MCGHHAQNLLVLTVLFFTWTVKYVWVQICPDNVCVSCLQVKLQRHHLCQNINGPAIARSAGPVPPLHIDVQFWEVAK